MEDLKILFSVAKMLGENDLVLNHGRQVARLSCAIAKKMKYSDKKIKYVHFAAVAHDIGKIKVPAEILHKPGILSAQELAVMRKHPELGFRILEEMKTEPLVARVAFQHHERMNGSGYPLGLRGKEILHEARIVIVADVVAAMVFDQPYRPALKMEVALAEIKQGSGPLYDPEIAATASLIIEKEHFKF
ncbi:MAG: HD domain-containing protein [Candidatus Omnitrophica bacterium]|jgi:putative nucleotidyltransferase with HDIG domain|nr:HD domain-containing protein [Candidatus Omnitrophota bacterium]MDD5724953.1 HD domain-containing protein [Candidatus Omnitrophota bacterium]